MFTVKKVYQLLPIKHVQSCMLMRLFD